MKGTRTVRFAGASCFHCPFQNLPAVGKLVRQLKDFRPEVFVCMGDLFEAEAASVHPTDKVDDIADEYRSAGELLVQLNDVLGPTCRKVWLLGNHDDNLQAPDPRRIPKALRKSVHWNRDIDWAHVFRGWEQIPYTKDKSGTFRVGQVIFAHGWDAAARSDFSEGVQIANMHGGCANLLIARGHTHRPRDITQVMFSAKTTLPWWVTNVGTMGPLKPDYMVRKDSAGWAPAVLIGEAITGRPSRMEQGRQWSAELIRL